VPRQEASLPLPLPLPQPLPLLAAMKPTPQSTRLRRLVAGLERWVVPFLLGCLVTEGISYFAKGGPDSFPSPPLNLVSVQGWLPCANLRRNLRELRPVLPHLQEFDGQGSSHSRPRKVQE